MIKKTVSISTPCGEIIEVSPHSKDVLLLWIRIQNGSIIQGEWYRGDREIFVMDRYHPISPRARKVLETILADLTK